MDEHSHQVSRDTGTLLRSSDLAADVSPDDLVVWDTSGGGPLIWDATDMALRTPDGDLAVPGAATAVTHGTVPADATIHPSVSAVNTVRPVFCAEVAKYPVDMIVQESILQTSCEITVSSARHSDFVPTFG